MILLKIYLQFPSIRVRATLEILSKWISPILLFQDTLRVDIKSIVLTKPTCNLKLLMPDLAFKQLTRKDLTLSGIPCLVTLLRLDKVYLDHSTKKETVHQDLTTVKIYLGNLPESPGTKQLQIKECIVANYLKQECLIIRQFPSFCNRRLTTRNKPNSITETCIKRTTNLLNLYRTQRPENIVL